MSTIAHYGHGPTTGLDQTALGKITTGFTADDVAMCTADADVLRALAEQVATIAASEAMDERRRLWRGVNALEHVRPPVFCDPENGWNEIITETQMRCTGALARRWEMDLRKEIFWGTVMGDDKPVDDVFVVPYTVREDDWGLPTRYHKPEQRDGAQSWDGPVQDYDRDLPRLVAPLPYIDHDTSRGCLDVAKHVFDGILRVEQRGTWWWSLGITLPAVLLRGLTNVLMDFLDQPDNLRALFTFISDAHLKKLDWLEQHGLLASNSDGTYVGSGGFGYTTELPAPDFAGRVRCADMWGFAESQETVGVSPEMYEECVFPAEKPVLDRFGLNCYGCCEPLHSRWTAVSRHHNLRRVSCSPWIDVERMAALLGDRHIFSLKPNPAVLALPDIDEAAIRRDLRSSLEKTRGCVVEIIMKDNHTLGGNPANAARWCRIAREEADRIAG